MPPWLSEILAWLKGNAAWLVSAWAVWIAVRGRQFDARRAYSEFVLKQRIDAATRLMQASTAHFASLANVADTQHLLESGTLPDAVKAKLLQQVEQSVPRLQESMARLDEANAGALPFFSRDLMTAAGELAGLHYRAVSGPGGGVIPIQTREVQLAMTKVLDVIQAELDVAGVIEYQRRLFKRRSRS